MFESSDNISFHPTTISVPNNNVNKTPIDITLEELGLSTELITHNHGETVGIHLSNALLKIKDPLINTKIKIEITNSLLLWQTLTSQTITTDIILKNINDIFDIIKYILLLPDDLNKSISNEISLPAINLTKLLYNITQYDIKIFQYTNELIQKIIDLINTIIFSNLNINEKQFIYEIAEASTNRTESLNHLLKSLPHQGY